MLPTATQVPPNPIAAKVSGGKRITVQVIMRIEDTQSGQVEYLYILFLEDGEIKAPVLQ